MNNQKNKRNKQLFKVMILVVSLMVLAFSGTYAYFTINFTGEPTTTTAKSGVFKVESSLENASRINNQHLFLISEDEKSTLADKITFTITSTNESTVDGTFNIYLKDINLSKNLYSKYLKWELLKGNEIVDSGNFSNAVRMDPEEANEEKNKVTSVGDIKLNQKALALPKNTTFTYTFRMYLLNDETKNQIELTEGSFAGRLYIEAVPVSDLQNQ